MCVKEIQQTWNGECDYRITHYKEIYTCEIIQYTMFSHMLALWLLIYIYIHTFKIYICIYIVVDRHVVMIISSLLYLLLVGTLNLHNDTIHEQPDWIELYISFFFQTHAQFPAVASESLHELINKKYKRTDSPINNSLQFHASKVKGT